MTRPLDLPGRPSAAAVLSPDGRYRYRLTRRWAAAGPVVRWIMLNPSTADANRDDATIRRCVRFTRRWGYSALVVHNLYALRATDPRELALAVDPVGPDNDRYLRGDVESHLDIDLTVCAWGAHPAAAHRAGPVLELLAAAGVRPHALALTASGAPGHPLYLPGDAALVELAGGISSLSTAPAQTRPSAT